MLEEDIKLFEHVLHRANCIFYEEYQLYVKDLSLLSDGREMKDIIIVDNKVESYAAQLENGIPIKDFTGEADDSLLLLLKDYLMRLKDVEDVRPVLREHFCLQDK